MSPRCQSSRVCGEVVEVARWRGVATSPHRLAFVAREGTGCVGNREATDAEEQAEEGTSSGSCKKTKVNSKKSNLLFMEIMKSPSLMAGGFRFADAPTIRVLNDITLALFQRARESESALPMLAHRLMLLGRERAIWLCRWEAWTESSAAEGGAARVTRRSRGAEASSLDVGA